MPAKRTSTSTVEPRPPLPPSRNYRTRVAWIEPRNRPAGTEVTLEQPNRSQVGRQQKILLTLPPSHGTLAAQLPEAGGLNPIEGSQAVPEDIVGTIIVVRLGRTAESGELQPITFESTSSKESKHAQRTAKPEQPEPATPISATKKYLETLQF